MYGDDLFMRRVKKIFAKSAPLSLLLALETISCSSVQGASPSDPVKPTMVATTEQSKPAPTPAANAAGNAAEPVKVQSEFQEEFARQLAKAGPKAEGWALFSESPMMHNGQRWIIKSRVGRKDVFKFCHIEQGLNSCKESSLTRDAFAKIQPTFTAADKLQHILPVVFDALTFEYLHAQRGNPQTKRVVFMTSHKPFPEAYQNLIKAFNVNDGKKN
jgi:hypothetical protein